jgi:hypothetical protein
LRSLLTAAALAAALAQVAASGVCSPAALTLKPGVPVNMMLWGMNQDWVGGSRIPGRQDVREAVKWLGLGSIRYPGGSISSFWDMPAGRFVPDDKIRAFGFRKWSNRYVSLSHAAAKLPSDALSVKAFADLCAASDVEPTWVLNCVTASQADQTRSVDLIAATWKKPLYVEMGNEANLAAMRRRFPSADDYIQVCKPVIRHIRQSVPGTRIAVAAGSPVVFDAAPKAAGDKRESEWNETLFKSRELYDAWVLHSYVLSPAFLCARKEAEWPQAVLALPEAWLDTQAGECRRRYGSMPIWLTEYNAPFQQLTTKGPTPASGFFSDLRNSALHALFVAGYLMGLVENSDIYKVAMYHSMIGMDGFGAIRTDDPAGRAETNAAGRLFSDIAAIARQASQMHGVSVSGSPVLDTEIMGRRDIPAIQAAAFSSADNLTVLILNRSNAPVSCGLAATGCISGSTATYTAGPVPKPVPWGGLAEGAKKPFEPVVQPLKLREGFAEETVPALSLCVLRLAKG